MYMDRLKTFAKMKIGVTRIMSFTGSKFLFIQICIYLRKT